MTESVETDRSRSGRGLGFAPPPCDDSPHEFPWGRTLPHGAPRPRVAHDDDVTVEHNPQTPGSGRDGQAPGRSTQRPHRFPAAGEFIAGFRLLSELGRGAFGRVFLAEESGLADRRVAVKITVPHGDEPRNLARLQHTNIVPVHSVRVDPVGGLRVMCMPYVGGANLADVLTTLAAAEHPAGVTGQAFLAALDAVAGRAPRTPSQVGSSEGPASDPSRIPRLHACADDELRPARRFFHRAGWFDAAVWIAARLAEALQHAHERGVVHHDLKPSNVLIADDGTPMILDFNLATAQTVASEAEPDAVRVGGTLPYMAPEQIDAFNPHGSTPPSAVDERSDIYALGLILYELLTLTRAYEDAPRGRPIVQLLFEMTAERRRQVPSPRERDRRIPWSLDAIVRKCLAPDPRHRYPSAALLAEDLRRHLEDLPLVFAPEPSPRERLRKWARRHPRLCGPTSLAVVATILVACLGAALWRIRERSLDQTAALRRAEFRSAFDHSRLLLNTTGGPAGHRERGLKAAAAALAPYRVLDDPRWTSRPLFARLPPDERHALREEIAELLHLIARTTSHSADLDERPGAFEQSLRLLDLAVDLDPAPGAVLYSDRARLREVIGDPIGAARDRLSASSRPPRKPRDLYLRGTARLADGDRDGAEADLARAVALDPKRFWAWFALGLCRFEQGRFAEAAGDFGVCTALYPRFAWPHLNRGLALAAAGRPGEARASYDAALVANPNFAEALINRGLVLLETDDAPGALHDFDAAVRLGRDAPELLAARAEALARLGRRAEADREFARALNARPADPRLLVARGFANIAVDPSAARDDFTHALAIDPQNARAHLGLAHLHKLSGDFRSAVRSADRACTLDPTLLDAVALRAYALARLGDPAAELDLDRLLATPTPHRLYNASCTLARLYQASARERDAVRAVSLLQRALLAGISPRLAEQDSDFESLRNRADFRAVFRRAPR